MKKFLKIAAILVLAFVLLGAGAYLWASSATNRQLTRSVEAHAVDFPVPFSLSAEEMEELRLTEEEEAELAHAQAAERGRHLVEARYACGECHGADFGGGTMVDAMPIGRLFGPNITSGVGSVTLGYTPGDWDRIVRHGIRKDGTPAIMPSEDFLRMSDQELSDIIVFLQSQPPVDREMPERILGPLGRVLVATGQIKLSWDMIGEHHAPHAELPPPAEVSVAFGEHLAGVCIGCHGVDLTGGKIAGGDPAWGPAANLTPHADGLAGWSYEDFRAAMREGRRPDGTELLEPMTFVMPFAQRMTDVEMEAMWVYLQSLPPREGG